MAEYRKITDEILKRMPDEDQYPRPAASVDPPIGRVAPCVGFCEQWR
ncbi:hypothetical protein RJJ37_28010 [Rhizobium redzepovicii]|uniref:Uncharacterized protein n=1 Tax=Rhizobium redzepovicii TaxID=2867518 RepID=A0AAW8PB28_9HYPH|nr:MULTISPECIES: hypothetical protein [Rhizobium]MBY3397148.1 hypothetical protein [Rhizobium laguerreae]MBY3502818.1 hypothetical protein [Rhizobium laguerreae]MBY3522802.1 hypothetical protein [Rhizobium laguerreae]MBY3568909.1 hypothetical protein [Rhizobium laguerreae]MDR9763429.1 hypothetical protein [Rhizobium redzepovicii]